MPEIPTNDELKLDVPRIEVTGPNNKPLGPGRYTFQVIVEDDLGAVSQPAEITITVAGAPMVRIRGPQQPVPLNTAFVLEAAVDDPNGVPVRVFRWKRTR